MVESLLEASLRSVGKAAAGQVRRTGFVSAVVYGRERPALAVKLSAGPLREVLNQHGRNALIQLVLEGEKDPRTVMIKDLRVDRLRGEVLHVDLLQIALDRIMQVGVPVLLRGEEELARRNLMVRRHLSEVDVQALPREIPEAFELDVSNLAAGDQITVADLLVPEKVTVLPEGSLPVVTVAIPARAREAAAGAGVEEAEEEEEGAAKEEEPAQ